MSALRHHNWSRVTGRDNLENYLLHFSIHNNMQTQDSILWGIYNNVSANDHGSSHSSIIGLVSVAPVYNDYLCLVYNSVIILIELGKLCYNWKESISRIMCQHSVFVYILILTLLLPPVSHLLLSYQYIITTLLKGFRYKQYWTIFFLVQTKQK